jgi:hypothetical protein
MHIKFLLENLKEKYCLQDNLKSGNNVELNLEETSYEKVNWINLAQVELYGSLCGDCN